MWGIGCDTMIDVNQMTALEHAHSDRISGAGVFLSRALIRRVPLPDILSGIRSHENSTRRDSIANSSTRHFESEFTASNGQRFSVASNAGELLISAYLPDETSGLSHEPANK